jgi:DNA-binding response OmpR family regulator
LRRCNIESPKNITVGTTKLNFESLIIESDGIEVALRPKEFYLLEKMLQSPAKIFLQMPHMPLMKTPYLKLLKRAEKTF